MLCDIVFLWKDFVMNYEKKKKNESILIKKIKQLQNL